MGRRRKKKTANKKTKKTAAQNELKMEDKNKKEPDTPFNKNEVERDCANETGPGKSKEHNSLVFDPLTLLPAAEDNDDMDNIDSESTTSVSTIECAEEDLERSRRYSNTPPKKSPAATPSPSSTTTSGQSSQQAGSSRSRTSTGVSGRQSPSPASSITPCTFPVRLGITWKIGAKVEAMDFIQKWYPARIVEINAADLEVLIHFEGWNSRYDEWVKMSSDRLRPLARHSERKESKKSAPKSTGTILPFRQPRKNKQNTREYKVGECVFAKWTDCRHYAARILTINPSGSYEVMFYDGFKKTVQPINVKNMPPEVQVEYANAGLLPPHPKPVVKRRRDSRSEVVEKTRPKEVH